MKTIILLIFVLFLASCTSQDNGVLISDPNGNAQEIKGMSLEDLFSQGYSLKCSFDIDGSMYGVHSQRLEVWFDDETIIESYEPYEGVLLSQIHDTTFRYPIEHSLRLSGFEGDDFEYRLERMRESSCDYVDMSIAQFDWQPVQNYEHAITQIEYYSKGGDYYKLVSNHSVKYKNINLIYSLEGLSCTLEDKIVIVGETCTGEEVRQIHSEV